MNPSVDSGDAGSESETSVSYAAVAARLLQDNFLLTALELHTELVECGRELPLLREFFSNPGNFEQQAYRPDPSMQRTPSQGTLDSLDMTRLSEDGGLAMGGGTGGSDVAVLEFELRKARETINSLRANLTQFADNELSDGKRHKFDETTLKPHEKRALNFLINEYLLLNSYNLTAITFSDENPDQDFEDWDDIGLNLPRPCGLISLYRGESSHMSAMKKDETTSTKGSMVDAECQTEVMEDVCVNCQTPFCEDTDINNDVLIQAEEIMLLKRQVLALETDKANYHKLYDAALASLNALTTPVSDGPSIEFSIPNERLAAAKRASVERMCEQPLTYAENHYGSGASTNSVTPEQFEMIDCEKNSGITQKDGSHASIHSATRAHQESLTASPLRRGSATTLDDTLSLNEAGEWTRIHHPDTTHGDTWIESSLPSELKSCLLRWCCDYSEKEEPTHDLFAYLKSDKLITPSSYVPLVAETLLRILPHTLVQRRCEAAALLAATVHLLSVGEVARRGRLLQLLLTLLKKPDQIETRVIAEATTLIVKWGGGGEVLSCIAELLSSRSAERRVLVSYVCLSIAPYFSVELCTSLLLSVVVLMCDASELEIRLLGLKAAILVCSVAEQKYGQIDSVFFAMLKEPSEHIRRNSLGVFAPVLARNALGAGKFTTVLIPRTMVQLSKYGADGDWKNAALYLELVRIWALPTLAHSLNVQIVKDNITVGSDEKYSKCTDIALEIAEVFLDLQCYLHDRTVEAKSLVDSMNMVLRENPGMTWPEMEWFLDKVMRQLLDIATSSKVLNHAPTYHIFINTFNTYCRLFGQEVTTCKIKPIFASATLELERQLEKLQSVSAGSAVCAGIYLAGVLPCCCNCEEEVGAFLKKWVVCSGVCGLPVEALAEPLKWMATHYPSILNHSLYCLREIVTSSAESERGAAVRAHVAAALAEVAASGALCDTAVDTHVLPVVVEMLGDTDGGVRERAIVALGAVTRLAVTRDLGCRTRCWTALEKAVEGAASGEVGGGEAARFADALAMLLAPDVDVVHSDMPLKVLSLLCCLCQRAPLTGDVLSSLIPGLQLAVHFVRPDGAFLTSTLLPALRRLERADSPSLQQHKQAVDALLAGLAPPAPTDSAAARPTILAGSEAVGRRVTQMFQQSKTNMNIPNIFKKKS